MAVRPACPGTTFVLPQAHASSVGRYGESLQVDPTPRIGRLIDCSEDPRIDAPVFATGLD